MAVTSHVSAVSLPGVLSPGAGFEAPFEMLEACHERVHRMLTLLARLRQHLAEQGNDTAAQQAARDVLRYFDMAAPRHHEDEELHVFPPLLARGDAAVAALVRRLQADHRQMESGWAATRAVLLAVAGQGLAALSAAQQTTLDDFAALYGDHIRAEEAVAYPAARALLDDTTLTAMSADMMRRRGVA